MLRLDVTRKSVDLASYRKRRAVDGDCGTLIREPCCLYENGTLRVVYTVLDDPLHGLRAALRAGRYSANGRMMGLVNRSAAFGFAPRNELFHNYCKVSQWAHNDPAAHAMVCAHASVVAEQYKQWNSALYAAHVAEAEAKVKPDWRIAGTPFTSGNVNYNSQLVYHFDSGNFADVWSCMIVVRDGLTGGHLALPEYDLAIECADRSVLMFDGQGLLHGVTPILSARGNGYRYSVVYYSLRSMWRCLPPAEELATTQQRRDAMESARAKTPEEDRIADVIRQKAAARKRTASRK